MAGMPAAAPGPEGQLVADKEDLQRRQLSREPQ
jgi:hypothetical protein